MTRTQRIFSATGLIILGLMFISLTVWGLALGGFFSLNESDAAVQTTPRKMWDLTEDEQEHYSYVKWSMYQSVYTRIKLMDNPSQKQINAAWDEYHKHVDTFNTRIFGK